MQGNGNKAVVCLIGYNFQADKGVKNGCKDFKWLGKVAGYRVDEIKSHLIEIEARRIFCRTGSSWLILYNLYLALLTFSRLGLHIKSELMIGSIVIDCINFEKMLAFWQEALHYVPSEPAQDGWVVLQDPKGVKPNISLNRVPKRLMGRNWLHFDLYTNDRGGEVRRLLKIGATCHPQTYDPDDDFRVLEDPDGNLFCIVDRQ